ncbi:hypothetical protein BKA65DRAFT_508294 [Rhexocercosporidium sp. MPI-PUGE-AT-0058]|nr:hypothetical protein BKA65DRAFT_508294 [Rhexocercosporidium sp. MPI-PUGE-AT-0058]
MTSHPCCLMLLRFSRSLPPSLQILRFRIQQGYNEGRTRYDTCRDSHCISPKDRKTSLCLDVTPCKSPSPKGHLQKFLDGEVEGDPAIQV